MSVKTDAIGKVFAPVLYAVGREKVREYAAAIGEHSPLHTDPLAAQAAGFPDVVAPPMFAVVYSSPSVIPALFDPEVGLDFARLVHGAQEFCWGPLVVAGDEVTTTTTVKEIADRGGMGVYVFETESRNQRDDVVSTGVWTNIVRGS
jgi:acyl dehydratase